MLGLHFCARAFSSCGKQGPLFVAVHGPLTVAASLVEEHKPQTRRLSSCGSRAHLLRGMWDLPRQGLEPVYPALAGRFSTTAPPGKPRSLGFILSDRKIREVDSRQRHDLFYVLRKSFLCWAENGRGAMGNVRRLPSDPNCWLVLTIFLPSLLWSAKPCPPPPRMPAS